MIWLIKLIKMAGLIQLIKPTMLKWMKTAKLKWISIT